MKDENIFSILIEYKDSYSKHHCRMESSLSPIERKGGHWKEGFPQAFIGQRKTSSKRDLIGDFLNLWTLAYVEGKGFMILKWVLTKERC